PPTRVRGQRRGALGGQARLAAAGFTADEDRLAFAALDTLPRLLERREFRGAPHQRAAATRGQLCRKRWWHPPHGIGGHALQGSRANGVRRIVKSDYRQRTGKCLVVVMTPDPPAS